MESQTTMKTSLLCEWPSSRRQEITSVSKDMEKRELLYTVGGNITTTEKSMVVPQNIKNRTIFKFLSKKIKSYISTKKF